jgi:hypothetical protein
MRRNAEIVELDLRNDWSWPSRPHAPSEPTPQGSAGISAVLASTYPMTCSLRERELWKSIPND